MDEENGLYRIDQFLETLGSLKSLNLLRPAIPITIGIVSLLVELISN